MSRPAASAATAAAAAPPPQDPSSIPWEEHVRQTLAKLHSVYMTYVKPLEDRYKYDQFKPSWFEETILNQRPFVTFFGPWSAGKSTFINHLLQSNYLWTGPQPTTAEFTVIVHGEDPGPLDGRVLVNAKDLPFKGLNEFGEGFLQNFQGFQAPHEILKSVTLIDTPGVLESAKEIHQRKYDYIKLSRWFAERSDLIFVMFDPTKLDAGMELKMMFKHAFKGMENKVRIVLNKADTVNTQELMRVYGSLFWNLSTMINSTEPPRVYVGSFWDQPYKPGTFHLLFSEEKTDLIHELTEVIPAQALDKKIASLIKRAKDVFVHSIIIGGMRSELPMLFGKDKAKRKALDNLQLTYEKVGGKYKMNWRDFPPVDDYRAFLDKFDLETFPDLEKVEKEGLLSAIRNCIDTVLPRMLRPVRVTAMADPRNKDQRAQLQQQYHSAVRAQFEGRAGIQGSSDVVSTALRSSAIGDLAASAGAASSSAGSPVAAGAPAAAMAAPPPAAAAPGMPPQMTPQMLQMMQMMQMMGGGAAPGAAMAMPPGMMMMPQSQPQQPMMAPPAPAAGGMDQMAMMMAMMQRQQSATAAAPQPSMQFAPQPSAAYAPAPQPSAAYAPAPQPSMQFTPQPSMQFAPAPAAAAPAAETSSGNFNAASAPPPPASPPTKPAPSPPAAPAAVSAEQQAALDAQALQLQQQMLMMQQLMAQQASAPPPPPQQFTGASQYADDD